MKRLHLLLAALVAITELIGATQARTAPRAKRPHFDASEARAIDRNDLLTSLVSVDPWLVRHILDLAALGRGRADPTIEALSIDPAANPDLALGRRDAMGSVEWIDLLKQAKAKKDKLRAAGMGPAPSNRSAEGSVEMIEMIRRAKAARQANP